MSKEGGGSKKFYLLGTDYVYPAHDQQDSAGDVAGQEGARRPTSWRNTRRSTTRIIRRSSARLRSSPPVAAAAVISTINGDSNVPFYKEFANQGLRAEDAPIMAFSVAEDELRGMDTSALVGHLAAWNYYQSVDTPQNKQFVARFQGLLQEEQPAGRRQAGHGRSDRSGLFRRACLEASGRKGRLD